jgi:thiol-disulfide isomerase/thioredoxin
MTRRIRLLLAALAVLVAGCTGKPPAALEVNLRPLDGPGLVQVLARHRGQVVLVDFWATWCGPCLKLLPHTLELDRRFRQRGLAVITVSLDTPADQPATRRFLANQGATTENYLSSYNLGPAAFEAFGIDDGALPHVQLYDRQGKLHRTFASGGKTIALEAVQRAVEELL